MKKQRKHAKHHRAVMERELIESKKHSKDQKEKRETSSSSF